MIRSPRTPLKTTEDTMHVEYWDGDSVNVLAITYTPLDKSIWPEATPKDIIRTALGYVLERFSTCPINLIEIENLDRRWFLTFEVPEEHAVKLTEQGIARFTEVTLIALPYVSESEQRTNILQACEEVDGI